MEATATHRPERRRGGPSLWPLALVPITGAVVIGLAIMAASRAGHSANPSHRAELAALTVEVRAVTPRHAREVELRPDECGARDSAGGIAVTRTLSFDRIAAADLIALQNSYVSRGWTPLPPGIEPGVVAMERTKEHPLKLVLYRTSGGKVEVVIEDESVCPLVPNN